MEGHAMQCVERYLELACKDINGLKPVSTPCLDDHNFTDAEFESKGELASVCSKIVLKCLWLARLCRPSILWAVSHLARNVTKWNQACDKRLARLIAWIYHTRDYQQLSYVGDQLQDCFLAYYADASFADDLQNSKSTSGGMLFVVGPNTCCPVGWICKQQGAVSHSSSEAEIISLDMGVRMLGIPSLLLWDIIVEVFAYDTSKLPRTQSKDLNTQIKESKDSLNTYLSN